jgi:hypothetical protein
MGTSIEYSEALERSREASRAFRMVTQDYRARRIGDREYLAARHAHGLAMAEFDLAWQMERDGVTT